MLISLSLFLLSFSLSPSLPLRLSIISAILIKFNIQPLATHFYISVEIVTCHPFSPELYSGETVLILTSDQIPVLLRINWRQGLGNRIAILCICMVYIHGIIIYRHIMHYDWKQWLIILPLAIMACATKIASLVMHTNKWNSHLFHRANFFKYNYLPLG